MSLKFNSEARVAFILLPTDRDENNPPKIKGVNTLENASAENIDLFILYLTRTKHHSLQEYLDYFHHYVQLAHRSRIQAVLWAPGRNPAGRPLAEYWSIPLIDNEDISPLFVSRHVSIQRHDEPQNPQRFTDSGFSPIVSGPHGSSPAALCCCCWNLLPRIIKQNASTISGVAIFAMIGLSIVVSKRGKTEF